MIFCYISSENKFQVCDCKSQITCNKQLGLDIPKVFSFVDESERARSHYFMGALVASEPQVQTVTEAMDQLMDEFSQAFPSLSPGTEFHASEMMNGKGAWKKVSLRAKFSLFRRVFTIIRESGARVFVEGIHYAKLAPEANTNLTPRERAFSHLFEKINMYGSLDNQISIIADKHHDERTSRSNFSSYRLTGVYSNRANRLENINPHLSFVDSRESRLLQAADMVTYIYNRLMTKEESDDRAEKFKEELWEIFKHSADRPEEGGGRIWP